MTRGKKASVGATRVSPNGYHYTKTTAGWELTHRLVAEKTLKRKLRKGERVRFKNGDRTDLSPNNIVVYTAQEGSVNRRKARLQARIEELQAELHELELSEQ